MEGTESIRYLLIINDGPYGSERPYNALRLAMNLVRREAVHVRVFLIGDGVHCAVKGQQTPQGYCCSSFGKQALNSLTPSRIPCGCLKMAVAAMKICAPASSVFGKVFGVIPPSTAIITPGFTWSSAFRTRLILGIISGINS